MATNSLLTPSIITKEALARLENNLVMAGRVNRQAEGNFGAPKIGDTLTIRKPVRYLVTKGAALQVQDTSEPSVNVTIDQQAQVSLEFSSAALTLTIEEFSERYIASAMAELANTIDASIIENFKSIYNFVGTPGTMPNTFAASVGAVGTRLDEMAAPQEERSLVMTPELNWQLADSLKGMYVNSVAEPALKGYLANIGNMNLYMNQNMNTAVTDPATVYGGTPQVNGSGQLGSSLITKGWTATTTTLKPGTVFNIAGVYSVNPRNRKSTGKLQDFVVTAASTTDGAGGSTLSISPPITPSGAYQTVTASPVNNANITIRSGASGSSHMNNLAFTRDAFGLVSVPLILPKGVDFAAQETYRGITMRIVSQYDIRNDVIPCRVDVLYGTTTYYPELAVRLTQ